MLTEDGNLNPKNRTKVIWGLVLAVIAIVLLLSGGLLALQNVLIIVALPFSFVMILMMLALLVELFHEKKKWAYRFLQIVIHVKMNHLNLMKNKKKPEGFFLLVNRFDQIIIASSW